MVMRAGVELAGSTDEMEDEILSSRALFPLTLFFSSSTSLAFDWGSIDRVHFIS